MAAFPLQHDIDYPESDGRPLGETERHRQEIVDLIYGFQQHYRDAPDVYAGGNMFLYYSQGNRRACVCPDVFVVKGVGKETRRTYKLWEEGRAPSLVVEVTSGSTKDEDLVDKKVKYALLGVEEYFLFDPYGEYLSPSLQGFRLRQDRYLPIPRQGDGSLASETAGLILQPEGERLRLVNAATGEPLPWVDELQGLRQAAEERAAHEAEARRTAEAHAATAEARATAAEKEIARLRRELAERGPRGSAG